MTKRDTEMDVLDQLFAEAAKTSDPSEALMARVSQDALALQPLRQPKPAPMTLWEQLAAILGGWQGMGGLVAATCAGLWIGVNSSQMISADTADLWAVDDAEVEIYSALSFDGSGWIFEEE